MAYQNKLTSNVVVNIISKNNKYANMRLYKNHYFRRLLLFIVVLSYFTGCGKNLGLT